jgi:hypothetical protein
MMLDQAHPKRGDTLQMPQMIEGPPEPPESAADKSPKQISLFDRLKDEAAN